MGHASHKRAGSYITIHSATPPDELLRLAEMVALQVFKRNPQKPGPIVVTGRTAGTIEFAIVNIFKWDAWFLLGPLGTLSGSRHPQGSP